MKFAKETIKNSTWRGAFYLFTVLEDADYNYIIDYDTYSADFGPKRFKGAGTSFLFKKQNQKETITAQGPLKKSVTLMVSINLN